jgi:protein transport protein SEC31
VGDLEDMVKNANLEEWKEVIVVVCTFASASESFERLLEILGKRLDAKSSAALEDEDADENAVVCKEWRKRATLAYLAAKKLESLILI